MQPQFACSPGQLLQSQNLKRMESHRCANVEVCSPTILLPYSYKCVKIKILVCVELNDSVKDENVILLRERHYKIGSEICGVYDSQPWDYTTRNLGIT